MSLWAGTGGVVAKVLVVSNIGDAVSTLLHYTGLPILAVGFLLTLLLCAARGSATVALVTTAGIITPLEHGGGYSLNQLGLIALAMAGGALAVWHINDAGFWIVTKLIGLSVAAGLRTWTLLTTILGTGGFLLTILIWQLT